MKSYRRTPARLLRRQSSERRQKRILISILAFMIVGGFLWFLNAHTFRISNIEIVGATTINEKAIREKVASVLSERYTYLIPKNNILFIPRDALRVKLFELSPKIKNIDFQLLGMEKFKIIIEERTPFAIWCKDKDDCFFIDDTGFSFERAPKEFGSYITFTDDVVPLCIVGCSLVSDATLRLMNTVENVFRKEGIRIRSVHHDTHDDYSIRIDTDTEVIVAGSSPIIETLNNIFSLMESSVFSNGGVKERLSTLKKIDARFGKKLYYTFK